MDNEVIESAVEYHRRGLVVTPTSGKKPVCADWPNLRLDEQGIRDSFLPSHNVGVVLGPSGLADLDFDSSVAFEALQNMRPVELEGTAVFEHAHRSHVIVRSKGVETRRFKRSDGTTLLELRGEGAQTVFPPSIHDDGLPYVWVRDCEPCEVAADRLRTIASMIATVAYASEFWTEGSRHELALALAGFLARRLSESDVQAVVCGAAAVAGDRELTDRESAVLTTVRRLKANEPVVGLPSLREIAPELAQALASWWETDVDQEAQAGTQRQVRSSQADLMIAIASRFELFHDPLGTAFVRPWIQDHFENWPLQSRVFKSWLRRELHLSHGKAPSADAVNAACAVLEGMARFDGSEHSLQTRVARVGNSIYYDLADRGWRAVQIDESGWRVVEETPTCFRRYGHQRPQIEPLKGGSLKDLLPFLNVRPEDQLLLATWLGTAYVPDIPHPIPDFHGEKGSGKSMGQRVLRRLIDPSGIELLSFPSDVRELVQQLAHHYVPVYDNVDNLPPWISDILCRAVTGEGFSKRELYSDDEDVIYSYRRVVMLNGVNVVARRPDLLDRSILIGLCRVSRLERREEREFWQAFEEARPYILGAIFDALSQAMRLYPTLKIPSLERMADFTRWGAAIAEALGYGAECFLHAYARNIGAQTLEAVQGHLVGSAVLALMRERDEWLGTPTELLFALEQSGQAAGLFKMTATGKVDAKGWPGGPQILGRRLNEIRGNLADLGFGISDGRDDERTLTIARVREKGSESSVGSVGGVGLYAADANLPDVTDDTDVIVPSSEAEEWEAIVR